MGQDLLQLVENAYAELPEVNCRGCGECCVSPTCFLSEFIYLVAHAKNSLSHDVFESAILMKPEVHPDYDGNLRCPFLVDRRCIVHSERTGGCRLFGVPTLNDLGIHDMVACKNDVQVVSGRADQVFIGEWLHTMETIEKKLYPYSEEPYFVRGMSVQCWLDVYFDETLNFDVFQTIKNVMSEHFDLSDLRPRYICSTGLRDKIDKISILSTVLSSGDRTLIAAILHSLKTDYPKTGTYFLEVIDSYLAALNEQSSSLKADDSEQAGAA